MSRGRNCQGPITPLPRLHYTLQPRDFSGIGTLNSLSTLSIWSNTKYNYMAPYLGATSELRLPVPYMQRARSIKPRLGIIGFKP